MSRFQSILLGQKARKTIEFPAPLGAEDYKPVNVDLIVLTGTEEAAAIAGARAYAKANGVDDPRENDPHYDLGLMVHTLVRACMEHAGPGSTASGYFFAEDEGATDFGPMVLTMLEHLDRERITYLYQLQQVWQAECSPWGNGDTEDQILQKLQRLRGVGDPAFPFKVWRPATVGSLLLSTVNRLFALLPDSWEPGSSSGTPTPSSTRGSPEASPAP